MSISSLGILGARFELNQVAEWAMRDAALTHHNLICQHANALFPMGVAHAIASGYDRKGLFRPSIDFLQNCRPEAGHPRVRHLARRCIGAS